MVSRGNRLVLEADFLEADGVGNVAQRLFGLLVGGAVVIDEKYRSPENGLLETAFCLVFGALLERADEFAEQVTKNDGAPIHFGPPVDQAAAEQAFQGTHQPPFVAVEVFPESGATETDAVFFRIEKDHRGQRYLAVFEREQRRLTGTQPANGRIGGAEIDAAGAGGRGVH